MQYAKFIMHYYFLSGEDDYSQDRFPVRRYTNGFWKKPLVAHTNMCIWIKLLVLFLTSPPLPQILLPYGTVEWVMRHNWYQIWARLLIRQLSIVNYRLPIVTEKLSFFHFRLPPISDVWLPIVANKRKFANDRSVIYGIIKNSYLLKNVMFYWRRFKLGPLGVERYDHCATSSVCKTISGVT